MKLSKIRQNGQLGLVAVDLFMVVLLLVNLVWILFDWLFTAGIIRPLLFEVVPEFSIWYSSVVVPRFYSIDLVFIAIYLTEFIARWIVAIVRRSFHRWFFFPFVHWYDLLGLIPLAGFRILRLLRVIAIALRLHRSGLIDLTELPAAKFLSKYYGIVIQEITDRVTVNLIGEVQDEVRHGGPVIDRIVDEVVRPHKEPLVEWTAHRIEAVAAEKYERYRGDIRRYVRRRINTALEQNRDFARLGQIPMFGSMLRDTVERAVSDMVFSVIRDIMQDFASDRNRVVLNETADIIFDALVLKEEDTALRRIVVDTVDRSLEIIKQHVSIQQWKLRDQAFDEEDFRRRMREELHRYAEATDD